MDQIKNEICLSNNWGAIFEFDFWSDDDKKILLDEFCHFHKDLWWALFIKQNP